MFTFSFSVWPSSGLNFFPSKAAVIEACAKMFELKTHNRIVNKNFLICK